MKGVNREGDHISADPREAACSGESTLIYTESRG